MNDELPLTTTDEGHPTQRQLRSYGLLFLVTLASIGVQGIARTGDGVSLLVTALAGASLVLAFEAARMPRWTVRVAAAVGTVVVLLGVLRITAGGIGEGAARTMNAALLAFGPPAITVGIVRDLRTSGRVRLEAVMGVLSLYMLLGLTFAFVYGAVDQLGGAPFFADGRDATVSNCVYFSFTTLATVGYGDLVARTNLGHTLAVYEMLIGQIFLVTVVSLIVSNLGRRAPRARSSTPS